MTKPTSYSRYILGAILTTAILLGSARKKDSTAQGVAKIRHCESMLDPGERLYVDPYAHHMYPGSWVQTAMGGNTTRAIHDLVLDGLFDILTLRTKWMDDAILTKATTADEHRAEQLVILGAGYDTRGFRLDFPDGFAVWEVDQPGVQSQKKRILEGLAATDRMVADRLGKGGSPATPHVEFLDIDFNKDSVLDRIVARPSFDRTKPTVVTLEGVSQYIPESSTAATLKQVRSFLAEGSILLISYTPSELLEDPETACPGQSWSLKWMFWQVEWLGEPWISSWKPTESFASFLRECGYEVVEDVGIAELNQRYLVPRNRGRKDDEFCNLERYVLARAV